MDALIAKMDRLCIRGTGPVVELDDGTLVYAKGGDLAFTTETPTILADSDRDGVVTIKDWDKRRFPWTPEFGAIFLPNIGQRLPLNPANVEDVGGYLYTTDNATGNELLNPELAAPLRTVPLRNLKHTTVGKVTVTCSDHVRLFCRLQDLAGKQRWILVTPLTRFSAIALADGLILAIDARTVVTDCNAWDGTATVNLDIHNPDHPSQNGHDQVTLRLAPLLLHHNLQPANLLLSRHYDKGPQHNHLTRHLPHANGSRRGLMELFAATERSTGVPHRPIRAPSQWFRDIFSVAYCTMPGRRGRHISIRILLVLPSTQAPDIGIQIFPDLCSPTLGLHPVPPSLNHVHGGQDSGGNIDIIPPYTSPRSGKHYPNGRVLMLMGDKSRAEWGAAPDPALSSLLASQGPFAQGPPLYIHADITAVGHIDEILTFVPDPRPGGTLPFTVVTIDPLAGLALLREINNAGNGHREVPRFPVDAIDEKRATVEKEWADSRPKLWRGRLPPQRTIRELLRDEDFLAANARAAERAKGVVREVCQEVGIREDRVVRLPVVCYPYGVKGQEEAVAFLLPNPVNGVVLGERYLASKQWGPVSGDDDEEEGEEEGEVRDVFARAVEREMKRVGMEVVWVDDFATLHILSGNVHCGTNTFREMGRWW